MTLNSQNLILGLDPNLDIYQNYPEFQKLPTIKEKLDFFCKSVLLAGKGLSIGVKFQSAYFEKYGLVGLTVLSKYLSIAKKMGYKVVLDAKRGDIDRTSTAYSLAYLQPESDFEADLLTVNAFLGTEASLLPFVLTAEKYHKGLFVLVQTSNPDAEIFQQARATTTDTVSSYLGGKLELLNRDFLEKNNQTSVFGKNYGPFGAVIGATKPEIAKELREKMPHTWFLCPGIGSQGADLSRLNNFLDPQKGGAWFPISSGITTLNSDQIEKLSFEDGIKENLINFLEN